MSPQEELNNIFLECYELDKSIDSNNCPICNYNIIDIKKYFIYSDSMWGTNKIIRIKCPNCDTIFGSITVMNMDYEKLSYCYSLVYSFFVEGDTANAQLNLFYKLKPIKNKKYLNYACGDWKGIEQIISADYDIYGYDPVISYNNTKILKNINQIPKQLDGLFSNNYI
jgi:hypothetical protein